MDWTRTDLTAPVASDGSCLRFDAIKMTAFEAYRLQRDGAEADYPADALDDAKM
ncbi:MAG: hypothetical protein MK098_04925 [Marinovum sp.]|nr:hypothetical protein [Marinovum sp.]